MKISASIITAIMLALFNSFAVAQASLAKGAVSKAATQDPSSAAVGAVNRKLEKKRKGKKSDAVCETRSKKDFDVGGFKYGLIFDANGGLTRTSLIFLARIALENPDLADDMEAALGEGPASAFLKYLEDTCGKSTNAEAFMDCAHPIVAEQKLCSPDCQGSLRYKYLDPLSIECTLMLALMKVFPGMEMGDSECLLGAYWG